MLKRVHLFLVALKHIHPQSEVNMKDASKTLELFPNAPEPTIIHVMIAALLVYPRHARRHSQAKLRKLKKSVQAVGLLQPIIVDEASTILSGHARVKVFTSLGYETIPAIRVTHLSSDEKAAFVLSANKFVEEGAWDTDTLKLELQALVDINCDLDLETTGFDIGEIDLIIGEACSEADEVPIPQPPKDWTTRPGDIWQLGTHRLLCGDCLDPVNWDRLMGGEPARICFTDPPYNVPIKGHVTSGNHEEFAMASGEMGTEEFTGFLNHALSHAARHTCDGGLHYICMDHRHLPELYAAADPLYDRRLNLIVWNKTNAGMGSFYRSKHEMILLYKVGTAAHINNVQLGKYGRSRSNVWTYAGANTFRRGRTADLADHPTVKPTLMLADALLDASNPGDIAIDGFGGSGSLILAAERTGRRAHVMELSPAYCDVIIARWEQMSGGKAVLVSHAPPALSAPARPLLLPAPDTEDQL